MTAPKPFYSHGYPHFHPLFLHTGLADRAPDGAAPWPKVLPPLFFKKEIIGLCCAKVLMVNRGAPRHVINQHHVRYE